MPDYDEFVDLVERLRDDGKAIYLGHSGGSPIFAGVRDSAVLVGPPGCGKTSSVFAPSVACHPGPVIVTSVRQQGRDPGIREVTIGPRTAIAERLGGSVQELAVDDRFGFSAQAVWWDFTEGCEEWNVALRRAKSLARSGIRATLENHHNWRTWVSELLAPLLFNTALQRLVSEQSGLVADQARDDFFVASVVANGGGGEHDAHRADPLTVHGQLEELLVLAGQGEISGLHPSITMLRKYCGLGELHIETRDTVFTLANSDVLSYFAYDRPNIDMYYFQIGEFLRSYGTLYITAGHGQAEDVRMIVASLLEAIEQVWVGIPYDERPPTLLLALDEVTTVAPIPSLPAAMGTYGGSGIQLLLGFQHSSQVETPWDKAGAGVINGANHLMIFPGLDDTEILLKFERLALQTEQQDREISVVKGFVASAGQANAARLIEERTMIEDARNHARKGGEERAMAEASRRIATKRGPFTRGRYGTSADEVRREIMEFTTHGLTSVRRTSIESSAIFSSDRHRVFLKSSNLLRFVDLVPYYRNSFWSKWLP